MSQLYQLVEQRTQQEALKNMLISHSQCLTTCSCWHNDLYAVRRLQEKLEYMRLLTDHLEATLEEIHRIEDAVFSC